MVPASLQQSVEAVRLMLAEKATLAVQIIVDLATNAESEKVQLDAAKEILDRTGVSKTQVLEVRTDQEEHARVEAELRETMEKLERNNVQRHLPHGQRSLDAVVVLEGDSEELPVAGDVDESSVIETSGEDIVA